ncbi:MAG: 30S ribosomal protein S8 [Candidatus Terrybacteria bacterium]|uniref:Small ribosomal subunit protein uS8 n=2 Tax=Candidatus Terryibacteriota TaxID=1817920 RepID=A0A1G2PWT8_9BACT|nr:30S ribosomal protein S8 [Candidatus Terrybacteria bacterium]OHA49469.1 MAG: 30S ribosomal protein S8 [Candidatus Terrybacteria bacterium RIFCSPHIGHO2_01_FULL_58_15]OHA52763.1 MAG: 30S ribosomal protein S8 [Candidatus Terrybacteria bacterium RIFCSPLOWO2_01_FULL_58_14]
MVMTDPIADFLTRVRNAAAIGRTEVRAPYSKILHRIAEILVREGFLEEVSHRGRGPRRILAVRLRYLDGKSVIEDLRRVSRPGRRSYMAIRNIRPVKSGFGIAVISTPEGLMTNREAKRKNIGGEVLCEVW